MIFDTNLLAPLEMDDGDIDKFINRNVCGICLGHLVKVPTPNRRWNAKCLEHGLILSFNSVNVGQAEKVEQNVKTGARELRPDKKPRKPSVVLKELGY